jgi:peptidoglycan/xylan/chitin deacetylase (PgdA/CDA1 family)
MNQKIVTTSWDDGHILDLKLAELLNRYDIAGTFYIAPENHEISGERRLSRGQIKKLSTQHEIGAHTMTHPKLSEMKDDDAESEIILSKSTLEDITGREITSFCYPNGNYKAKHETMVRDAGFSLARTVIRFSLDAGNDPFAMLTTVHAYRHWSDIMPILQHTGPAKMIPAYFNWDDLAISLFDRMMIEGGVFHLWGHSWEIEQHNDWHRLERVLRYIARRSGVNYLPNNAIHGK